MGSIMPQHNKYYDKPTVNLHSTGKPDLLRSDQSKVHTVTFIQRFGSPSRVGQSEKKEIKEI